MTEENKAALDAVRNYMRTHETKNLSASICMTIIEALQAPAIPHWQSIETAPKDGSEIIIIDAFGYATTKKWSNVMGGSWQDLSDDDVFYNPRFMSGWIKSPQPAKTTGENE